MYQHFRLLEYIAKLSQYIKSTPLTIFEIPRKCPNQAKRQNADIILVLVGHHSLC